MNKYAATRTMAVACRLIKRPARSQTVSRYALTGACSRYFEISAASDSADSYLDAGSCAIAFSQTDRRGRGSARNLLPGRRPAIGQGEYHHCAERKDIRAWAGCVSSLLLRCHESGSSHNSGRRGHSDGCVTGCRVQNLSGGVVDSLGQAPVHHQHLAEGTNHDVSWFQVSMQHASRVGEGQRFRDAHD